jgi:hypothetical protein
MTKYRGVNKVSIDTFNSGAFDTTKWTSITGADRKTNGSGLDAGLQSKQTYDLTNKIVAMKWRTPSGTTGVSTECDFAFFDSANHFMGFALFVSAAAQALGSQAQLFAGGGPTVSVGSFSGFNSQLVDGVWVGVGFLMGNKLRVFTSTDDGATWSLVQGAAFTGSITMTALTVYLETYHTNNDVAQYHTRTDEIAIFSLRTAKVRVSGAWADANAMVRVGGAWQLALPKRRVGGAWV